MPAPQTAPYGSWKSPITSELIVSGTIKLGQIVLDGADIYWSESRPTEGGRSVIVRRSPDGTIEDMTPSDYNVRTRVHEYGGADFTVVDKTIYFANFADQRLYIQRSNLQPQPITPDTPMRYADIVVDKSRNRLICVREDHRTAGREPVNTIAAVDIDHDQEQQVLLSGNDFYAAPRISPDGNRLAWLTWNHPNMPWDGTELWLGELRPDGSIGRIQNIAGGTHESIFQPEWSPDGVLFFVSDRTGWWNFYRYRQDQVEPVCPREFEFGRPQWLFGMRTYECESAGQIICTYTSEGSWHLAGLNCITGELETIEAPYNDIWNLRASPGQAVFCAGSPTQPSFILRLDLESTRFEFLRRSSDMDIDKGYLSIPEAIEFPTEHGKTAHGFCYGPQNQD